MTPDRCQRVTLNGPLCGGALRRDQYGDLACLCGWVYVPDLAVAEHMDNAATRGHETRKDGTRRRGRTPARGGMKL